MRIATRAWVAAYDIASRSYSYSQQAWDGANHRLDALLSFLTTVTIAVPVAVEAVLADPDSPFLVAAGAVYLASVLLALVARSRGSLIQISPKELHDNWLYLDEFDFKTDLIYWAGEHGDAARKVLYRKAQAANLITAAFAGEALLFLIWIARQS